jgi:VanZ family protein
MTIQGPRSHVAAHGDKRVAVWLLPAAATYTLFPIYGSLIPFEFHAVPIDEAVRRFGGVLQGPIEIASRTDFAANVLLALPLGLLWMAVWVAYARPQALSARAAIGVGVWLVTTVMAVCLELAQVFFGHRSPALSDVVAQCLGGALGVIFCSVLPMGFWRPAVSPRSVWVRLLGLYLAGLVLYALLPLDLTLSRSELAQKVTSGGVHLVPFSSWAEQPLAGGVGFVLDAALWALAAWLGRKARPRAVVAIALGLVALSVAIEVAQVFVLSRVVDTTDVLAAMIGIAAGSSHVVSTGRLSREAGDAPHRWWAPALVGFTAVVLNLYPFDFVLAPMALRERLLALSWVPFSTYTANTEIYLVTNLLRRVFLYGAFAVSVQWAIRSAGPSRGGIAVAAGLSALLAAVVEVLQIAMPSKTVDVGDVLLASLVGGVTAAVVQRFVHEPGSSLAARAVMLIRPSEVRRPGWMAGAWAAALLLLGVYGVGHAPGVPYNVRELLASEDRIVWPGLAVTAGLLLMFGGAAYIARLAGASRRRPALGLSAGQLLAVAGLLGWLITAGVARESVEDVVGSPVLGVWPAGELWGRLAVLLLGAVWALAIGHSVCGARPSRPVLLSSVSWALLLHGLWIVPLWHIVVVEAAATDNLVELMAGGGSVIATLSMLLYGTVIAWAAGAALRFHITWAATGFVLSAVIGYGLLAVGTESVLIKYGRAFSALQFLLSADRDHYASGFTLWTRFFFAHATGVVVAIVGALVATAWNQTPWRPSPAATEVDGAALDRR